MQNHSYIERYHQNEFLLAYIHKQLSDEEQLAFENYLSEDEMLQDALEGLKNNYKPNQLEQTQAELAIFLQQQTKTKSKLKRKNNQQFTLFAAIGITLLLLLILGIYLYYQTLTKA